MGAAKASILLLLLLSDISQERISDVLLLVTERHGFGSSHRTGIAAKLGLQPERGQRVSYSGADGLGN